MRTVSALHNELHPKQCKNQRHTNWNVGYYKILPLWEQCLIWKTNTKVNTLRFIFTFRNKTIIEKTFLLFWKILSPSHFSYLAMFADSLKSFYPTWCHIRGKIYFDHMLLWLGLPYCDEAFHNSINEVCVCAYCTSTCVRSARVMPSSSISIPTTRRVCLVSDWRVKGLCIWRWTQITTSPLPAP